MNAPLNHFTFQQNLGYHNELIVDLFAGGGGASEGIRMASGRNPDIAINHSNDALSMHEANHPDTKHFIADVFEVDPREATQGIPVGHLHLSPDCTHHSQARGGQPRNEKVRALSWVGAMWAGKVRPRVMTLENVYQVEQWGPLIAKRDKATGRVVTLQMIKDPVTGKMVQRVADKGERVPREFQHLVPDPKRKGRTWKAFIGALNAMGYEVKTRRMRACDYGAGTKRNRLFMVARCDGVPIKFPEPSHFESPKRGKLKWSAAHEHIDFTIESESIFDRKNQLKDTTLRRVAKGIDRYVLKNPTPFIVPVTHSSSSNVQSILDPLNTITTAKGGEFALATPVIIQAGHGEQAPSGSKRWGSGSNSIDDPLGTITGSGDHALATASMVQMGYGEANGQEPRTLDIEQPIGTVTAGGNKFGLVTTFLAQFNNQGNGEPNVGHPVTEPISAIMANRVNQGLVTATLVTNTHGHAPTDLHEPIPTLTTGGQQTLVSAHLCTLRNNQDAESVSEPISTICTSGAHHALVECTLSEDDKEKALRVSAFLTTYYGNGQEFGLDEPMATITTKDRLALVTVIYKGTPYVIVDIKLRMLKPKELFSAQGFGKHYIIDRGHDGRKFSQQKQVRMCGNSVSPYPMAALYKACHQDTDMRLAA